MLTGMTIVAIIYAETKPALASEKRNTLQAIAERCAAVCSPMRNEGGTSAMRPFHHKRPLSLQGGKAAPCRISAYEGAFLQIVARLRHAAI